ncbi:MAG: PD40 domain-containing protein [Gemmatimonadota bacterium]|nr:MAG: PD40 domain-containing protein [Gemmatimonadota bacterium]
MARSRFLFLLALLLLSTVVTQTGRAQNVAEVQLAPGTMRLAVGERRELLATAYDRRGDIVSTARFVWVSSNPGVARVEADPNMPGIAEVVGVAEGLASIEAKVGDRSASSAIQVSGGGGGGTPVPVGNATVLQIEPGSVFLLPTEDVDLRAVFLTDDGSPGTPSAVTWRSLTPTIATVSERGSVVGLTSGQGVVEAVSAGGLIARVSVQISQATFEVGNEILALSPGQSDTVVVSVPQQNHRQLESRRLMWRSTDPSIVTVSPIGMATGVGAGHAELVVSGYGQENRLAVTVHRPVEFLETLPRQDQGPVAVPMGGAIPFSATPLAADETPVLEAPLTWSLPDTTIASFDPATGLLTGKSLGATELQVRAPGEGLEQTWQITVIEGGLSLDVERMSLGLAETHQLKASFTDQSGTPVSDATGVTWVSTDPAVLEVDDVGKLSPGGFGTAQVVVSTPWGSADTTTVYVQGEVLVTYTSAGQADLYSFDRDQVDTRHQVTDLPGNELNARYSPDGTKIAYVSDERGNIDIYVADGDGSNPMRLTTTVAFENSPAWTPDGQQIVFESDAGGTSQIWIMNVDGSDVRQLTHGEYPSGQPVVSPNGQTIAFSSERDEKKDIYLMNLDGANQRNFTSSDVDEVAPEWLGDSTLVYMVEERERRVTTRSVQRMNFAREVTQLSPAALSVDHYAVSPAGDLLAVVVSAEGPGGTERRLYLIPMVGESVPQEVPRGSSGDQILSPSFRP